MRFTKGNVPFVLGVTLPFFAVAFIGLWMRLSSTLIQPQHDFIYITGPRYYRVVDDKIIKSVSRSGRGPEEYPTLYRYDVETGESQEILFEDAEQLSLLRVSPDGFLVRGGTYTTGFLPMFRQTTTDYTQRFLVKDSVVIPLRIDLKGDVFDNFSLIGWIQ